MKDVAIVVQKEDFLRPDGPHDDTWKGWLRERYDALRCRIGRQEFLNNGMSALAATGNSDISPVRCVGTYNRDRSSASPKMHNKFLIFAKMIESEDDDGYPVTAALPYGVWTGSYNLTKNSGNSLENAVYLTNPDIVMAYYQEWGQIMALSEPLDWTANGMEPEWGTGMQLR
jgi:hypothetical protein